MKICYIQDYNQNFQGIYKLKTLNNKDSVTKFLNDNDCVIRISDPFKENNEEYMYAITTDGYWTEAYFENDLRKNNIPFWKSLPLVQVINKKIIGNIFKENKKICGEELWTN